MIDTQSTTWSTVAAWLDDEIRSARETNDRPLPLEETIALRARIAVLKDLRELPDRIAAANAARDAAAGQYQAPTFSTPADYR